MTTGIILAISAPADCQTWRIGTLLPRASAAPMTTPAELVTYTGCIAASNGGYSLYEDTAGIIIQLVPSKIKLTRYIGRHVEISGTVPDNSPGLKENILTMSALTIKISPGTCKGAPAGAVSGRSAGLSTTGWVLIGVAVAAAAAGAGAAVVASAGKKH